MSTFINGNIITLNGDNIAEAFIVKDGRFSFVGTNEEVKLISDNEIIDLHGKTVVPGFIDSHMHFLNYAVFKNRVDLSKVTSIDDLIVKLQEYISNNNLPEGHWIICRGWNQNNFTEKRLLNRHDLDKISTRHPIFLPRICGHIAAVNSKALEVLGIDAGCQNPEGGVIDKLNGSPTGILRENALNLVYNSLPPMQIDEIKMNLLNAFNDALKCGLTTIYTEDMGQAGSLHNLLASYRALDADDKLPLRFVLQLNLADEAAIEEGHDLGLKSKLGNDYLSIGALKLYQDGSLGGRTAAMENKYADADSNGVIIYSQEELDRLVSLAAKYEFQLAIHAIGDRSMRMILDAYKKISDKYPEKDLRSTIIHCQFINSELLKRFKELNVVANVQPSFVMTDWPTVENAVGVNTARESYGWKDILSFGINMCFSSDAPIESFNPILGIYAAVTRKDLKGAPLNGWHPEQKLSVLEALKAFTLGSAYMNFEEDKKGSIELNKLADFVILSDNILTVPEDNIKDVEVLETYVGGKKMY